MALPTGSLVTKDPQAEKWPKGIDWTAYLANIDPTEQIATSAWTITGADALLTYSEDSIVVGGLRTQLKLSDGTPGVKYTVTNQIVTSSGIIDEQSFLVLVQQG